MSGAVCFALPFEASGWRPPRGWEVWVLGRAGRHGEPAFRERCDRRSPDWCVGAGLAGGLAPDLAVGAVVVEGLCLPSSPRWRSGRVATLEAPAATPGAKLALRLRTAADVCDMETGWQAAVAAERGFRYVAARAVSDDAHTALPVPPGMLLAADGSVSPLALLRHALGHPAAAPAIVAMARDAFRARSRLHEALDDLLPRLDGACGDGAPR